MKEIEVKILEVNRVEVEKKLVELGAKKVFEGELHILLFDFENKSLRKNNKILRLRKEGDKNILCYKFMHQSEDVKIADEKEIFINDFELGKKILENIGFVVVRDSKKHRTSYALEKVKFDLDEHIGVNSDIPLYLEIEADNKEDVFKYAKLLGFDKKSCLPWTFPELIKHYRKS